MADLTIAQRVEAGADLLDRSWPGWWHSIDLDLLDIAEPTCCVLGQLFETWEAAPDALAMDAGRGFYYATDWRTDPPMTTEAIDATMRAIRVEYADLTEAWRTLIEERRSGVPA